MLELKNVSKYYYNKGIITSGFVKVNLKLDMGEFVAITGESGSGKSTLLNVISGLISYEEGEMYINGNETSYYTEKDYENYRKKYVGNIFQSFNLVNSYTVFQNIELVFLLNGYKRREVKKRVLELIDQVELTKYKNRKVSKLSGGQKQRVAIARALAQDTPIILADEPTGNLDKRSSEKVLELLHDISKDKLVIVVTHNYDQIEQYVTRKITMHDGRIIEDKTFKKVNVEEKEYQNNNKKIRLFSKIRLGIRNAFNIIPKFLIITVVYLLMCFGLFFIYEFFNYEEKYDMVDGINYLFDDPGENRVVINKKDRSAITEEDFATLEKLDNIKEITKNDLLNELGVSYSKDDYYYYAKARSIKDIKEELYGRVPENNYEIALRINPDNNYDYMDKTDEQLKEMIGQTFRIDDLNDSINNKNYDVTLVGIIIDRDTRLNMYSRSDVVYLTDEVLNKLTQNGMSQFKKFTYIFLDNVRETYIGNQFGEILPSGNVPRGKILVSDDYTYSCKKMNCKNAEFHIKSKDIYAEKEFVFYVSNVYKKNNFKKLTGYNYNDYNGRFFINPEDFNSLFENDYYQSSVFLENTDLANETLSELDNLGYKTLFVKENKFGENELEIMFRMIRIFKNLITIGAIVGLFFISYLVIKIVLKSRNVYYSTLRILGSTYKCTKELLNIELLTVSTIAYIAFFVITELYRRKILESEIMTDLLKVTIPTHYVALAVIILFVTLLITERFSRKLFVDSVMNTYKEEI